MQTPSEKRQFVVPPELDERPLDGVLKALGSLTWGKARELIERGKIRVAGKVVTDGERRVHQGQTIELDPAARKIGVSSLFDRSAILHYDPHVVVVNKPAGMSTVPFEPGERGTLDQAVISVLPRSRGKGPAGSLGVVQRLDKETSGVLVFARTFAAKKSLSNQLRVHSVHRRYLAIVHGAVEDRTFRSYIVKDRGDRMRGTSQYGREAREGQLAVTHVEQIEALHGATLVACRLETGRTHQIRIHLSEAGHPIVGERVYVRDYKGELISAPRPMLHAAELGFVHPFKETEERFDAPPPADFQALLEKLRR